MENLPSSILDANSAYRGVSTRFLMGKAGKQATREILKKWRNSKKIQIFCGSGGNGGDGFVVALEMLKKGLEVEVILASEVKNEDAKFYFAKLPKRVIRKYSKEIKIDGDILVDALLGVGIEGKLKPPFDAIVRRLGKAKGKVVSLDIPTKGLKPKLVVAFHASKNSKNEVVVDIGIPKTAQTHFGVGDVKFHFPRRGVNSHKGENGKVVVVGGSRDYVGAPIFASLGCIASGVDLVYVWIPRVNFEATRKASPNFLVKVFKGDETKLTREASKEILDFAKKENATIVLGCGLGRDEETQKAILKIVKKTKQPLVIDGDALLPNLPTPIPNTNTILTPHKGELKRLGGDAKKLAKRLGVVVLEKGKIDAIHDSTQTRWSDSGNALLSVGGSGDVLSGLVGGLLSRGVDAFNASGIGSFLLGIGSEKLALKYESITPQILAKEIPKVIQKILTNKI